ncbi:NUDIX hydrolase [Dictyobacter alpinus]|uniref:NUDIX hydrolase n=1 Tax=Dictyobacter alpinus TaxID=2014873 RepID=A0A402BIL3_9CHLR|nr:NUDIX hydrolase [Dictyobacter alpinus]GCE31179.1 NUDIX hydrolase [Dictyobacter alpinus]
MSEEIEKQNKPWQVLKSHITYEDRWFKLRSDTCQTAEGHIITPYHVIEATTWVNVVALTQERHIVLVRQYRHGVGQILTGLPGGAMEEEDISPRETVRRELLEETGYGGGEIIATGQSYANPSNQTNMVYSFLARGVERIQNHTDELEGTELVLQDFACFQHQAWSGEIPMQALHLAALGFAEQHMPDRNFNLSLP